MTAKKMIGKTVHAKVTTFHAQTETCVGNSLSESNA